MFYFSFLTLCLWVCKLGAISPKTQTPRLAAEVCVAFLVASSPSDSRGIHSGEWAFARKESHFMSSRVTSFLDERLEWHCDPTKWEVRDDSGSGEAEGSGGGFDVEMNGSTLVLRAPAKKDFWRRTFYTPLLVKSDASGLLYPAPSPASGEEFTLQLDFRFSPVSQFDQAGVLLFIDEARWMKCGIEYCDGSPRLSVVVCNEFSDWSTQHWHENGVRLKVHSVQQSSSFVVEASPLGKSDYQFVRIGHLDSVQGSDGQWLPWRVGPFAACPTAQKGCQAVFTAFSIGPREKSVHSASLADH